MEMNNATLDKQIHELVVQIKAALLDRGESMATAESCTGGLIAASIVAEPGSSDILAGGIVAYRNEVKENLLGVPHAVLEQCGAVSAQTVEAMAEGALRKFGCQWAVSTSGIAGPTGAEPGKPVGFIWMCVANNREKVSFSEIFDGNRNEIRQKSVLMVLGKLLFLINNQKSTCTNEH
jgi:nicotinamide-nucleotide amidase